MNRFLILVLSCVPALGPAAIAQQPPEQPRRQGLYILASTRMQPLGLPSGTSFVDFGPPAINARGQVAFLALTDGPSDVPGERTLGWHLFRLDPDHRWSTVVGFARSQAGASAPSLEYADCRINDRGDIAAIGMDWMSPRSRRPQQILSTTKADDPLRRLAESGNPAPGIPETIFQSFEELRLSENGRITFIARLADKGAPPRRDIESPRGVWTSARGEPPVLLMRQGGQAPGLEPAHVLSSITDVKSAGEWLAINADIQDPAPDQPTFLKRRPAVWLWHSDTGFQLLLKAGDPVPALAPGEVVQYASAADIDEHGNALIVVFVARPTTVREFHTVVLARSADGSWRKLIRVGDPIMHAGQQRQVLKVGSALWSRIAKNEAIIDLSSADEPPNPRQFPHLLPWRFSAGGEPAPLFTEILRPGPADAEGPVYRYIGGIVLGPAGDAYFKATFGAEDENGWPKGPRRSAMAHVNPRGEVRLIQFDSATITYAPGVASRIARTQAPSSGMSAQGELVFKIYLSDGGTVIAKGPAEQTPEPTK